MFRERLRLVKDVDLWDLGDICLAQCEDQNSRVTPCHMDNGAVVDLRAQDGDSVGSNYDTQTLYVAGSYGSFESRGHMWTDSWDQTDPMEAG